MKYLNNNFFRMSMAAVVLVVSSCQMTDMDVKDSPNALTPANADVDLFVNAVQLGFNGLWFTGTDEGMEVTRMITMFGPTYQNAYSPETFDTFWSSAYATVLQDIEVGLSLAEELPNHQGVFKIFKAYTYLTLVDHFGDVPFTDANQGSTNLAPGLTDGQVVYNGAIALLDEAIAHFDEAAPFTPKFDFFTSATGANYRNFYTRVANTLKMRAYLNMGDATGFDDMLAEDYIDDASYDFAFQYGTSIQNPGTRHPEYGSNYDNGASTYMSNTFMNRMVSSNDPRIRFYFYRQETSTPTDVNAKPCIAQLAPAWYAGEVFCNVPNGYWGRDHGNNDGIPPDGLLRTIWGVYPVGGKYDNSDDVRARQGQGGAGAGINPFMLSFYVDFMRAEAALTLGTGEDAEALLSDAIDGSMAKVTGFPAAIGYDVSGMASLPNAAALVAYRDDVIAEYQAAGSNAERLEIVIREYYMAAFGNGYEAYNMYRRTGYPSDLQPTLKAENPGSFIKSFWLPANAVNRNANIDQKDIADEVFWDPGYTLN